MTLHTTQDGQITYEGLPVVNQEEVKAWIWEILEIPSPITTLLRLKCNHDYELPDEEFEVFYLITDGINEVIKILRKPVSEEGEKNKGLGEEFDLWDYVKREYQLLRMNGNSENEAFNKISGRYNITVKP